MRPFHFGSSTRPLFATFHPAQATAPRATSVLLCNPFGEEAVRAHRMYRVLANRLARAGCPTLRFDHLGTGDSAGSAEDVTVDEWLEGIVTAAKELRSLSGVAQLAVVGLRLGGTLAALATTGGALAARHLLLWDPIVDGAIYLRELAASHAEYLREEMGAPQRRAPGTLDSFPEEALGHPVPPAFSRAVASIDLVALEALNADRVTVVTTRSTPELARWKQRHARSANVAWIEAQSNVPWNSDAAVNNAVVPTSILDTLVTHIEERNA